MKLTKLFLPFLVLIALVACDNDNDTDIASGKNLATSLKAESLSSLSTTSWSFTNYVAQKMPENLENKITLVFTELSGQNLSYGGKSLVNNYAGTFTVEEGTGLITKANEGLSTLVASDDELAMQTEQDYYKNLSRATYFEIKDSTLTLYLGNTAEPDTEKMLFTAQ